MKGSKFMNVVASLLLAVACVGVLTPANAVEPRPLWLASTYDLASLADGVGATAAVTVKNAALGDVCFASLSVSVQGISVTCNVTAADTVNVRFQNETTGTLDLASATLRVAVLKKPL